MSYVPWLRSYTHSGFNTTNNNNAIVRKYKYYVISFPLAIKEGRRWWFQLYYILLLSINSESAGWTQFDFCRSVNGMRSGGDQLYNIVGVYKHIYIQTTTHLYNICVVTDEHCARGR